MKILITTPFKTGEVGGPAQYAPNLEREFKSLGHEVKVASYGNVERSLPLGLRHLYFFTKILPKVIWTDAVLALDTFSIGVPSVFAARMFRKKTTARIGGDFLWEIYVNRTGEKITLPDFYKHFPVLNWKERFILFLTRLLLEKTDTLAFNTDWQKSIWGSFYSIPERKTRVVRNFMPEQKIVVSKSDKLLWAGRRSKVKNLEVLSGFESKVEYLRGASHPKVLEKIRDSYAVIMPSLSDVCPNFILEAASLGKPFVMTKETGLNEILPKGGIFIDPLDRKSIEEAVFSIYDEEQYNRYVRELTDSYKPRSWRAVAKDFLRI